MMGEPHSSLRAAPATANLQEPVQASLSLAHDFIAQGNTTAALQVRHQIVLVFQFCWVKNSVLQLG